MLELLKFSTHCFWHFVGTYAILSLFLYCIAKTILLMTAILTIGLSKNMSPHQAKQIKKVAGMDESSKPEERE